MHFTQYGRRLKVTLISGMTVACLACIVAFPFADKKLLKNKAGYFSIQFNGQEVGAANTREEAEDALAAARLRFSQEYDSVIYLDNSIDINTVLFQKFFIFKNNCYAMFWIKFICA